jgi:hypothetical protein
MSYSIPKKFYSYLPLLRFYAKFTTICSCAFLMLAIIGQWHSGRLPAYTDLAFAVLVPMVAFVVIAILLLVSDHLYPLTVTATGLDSYNCLGRYDSIAWQQIIAVEAGEKFGLKCLYVSINTFKPPFVVPLWLHELNDFCMTVEQYAGTNNPLTIALKEATHYKN